MGNRVTVSSFNKSFRKNEDALERVALSALEYLKKDNLGIDIFLIGNSRMFNLNKEHLGKEKSTNVLSFEAPAFPSPSSKCIFIGEIYLCPPYIFSNNEDIEYMLVHGLLHLLGFLHEDKSDRIVMENIEKDIMSYIRG